MCIFIVSLFCGINKHQQTKRFSQYSLGHRAEGAGHVGAVKGMAVSTGVYF